MIYLSSGTCNSNPCKSVYEHTCPARPTLGGAQTYSHLTHSVNH